MSGRAARPTVRLVNVITLAESKRQAASAASAAHGDGRLATVVIGVEIHFVG